MTAGIVGNFRLGRLLGEGGMGMVYEAEHATMGRRAAVKILRRELARDPATVQRFFNEARAVNEVRHPGIVQIYDCGLLDDGTPWLIMELLEGETLSARMARVGRLGPDEVVEIGVQAASALAAAHKAGIIHRDLKPENLFVVGDPEDAARERVKVLDFGIAKLESGVAGALRTSTGLLMGTPLYMSPEQCRGTKKIDARSDIYSLGLILYQAVAGEPPFTSEGLGELFNFHMNVPAPPLESKRPGAGTNLADVIHRALNKDPAARFQSMNELQEALRAAREQDRAARKAAPSPAEPPPQPMAATALAAPSAPVNTPTTLLGSAAEVEPEIEVPARHPRRWLFVAAAVAAIGAVTLWARAGKTPRGPVAREVAAPVAPVAPTVPTAVVAPTAAPVVVVDIVSVPAGARVVDAATGDLLGVTPLRRTLAPAKTERQLRVEKHGFVSQTLAVPKEGRLAREVRLERVRAAAPDNGERIIKL